MALIIEGRLISGQAKLPRLWEFGEWVAGGKAYKVEQIDCEKLRVCTLSWPVKRRAGKAEVLLKILCIITLIPYLIGIIAKAIYRSSYTIGSCKAVKSSRDAFSSPDISPIASPALTPGRSTSPLMEPFPLPVFTDRLVLNVEDRMPLHPKAVGTPSSIRTSHTGIENHPEVLMGNTQRKVRDPRTRKVQMNVQV